MHILRVAHRLYPPTLGGSAKYAHELSRIQAANGHRVVVFTSLESNLARHEWRDGYEIYRFSAPFRPFDNPITLSMAGPLVQQSGRFDLLCAQSHLMFPTLLAAVGSLPSKTPFILTNHGFSVHRDRVFNAFQSFYLNVLCRWIFRRADYVINFTQTQRNQVISLGVAPSRAVVIPSGVDTTLFEPNLAKEDPYSILWIGRLVPEKGLEYLVKAMPEILRKIPQARLRIVGYGDGTSLMKLVSELALERKVEFLGILEGEKLAIVFNESAIFVLPSLSEGLSFTVLEAMACAKPIIVTAGIGFEEVLGSAGLFVPPGSVGEIAKATVDLLRNKGLRLKLGRIARRTVEHKYSWTRTASQLEKLYQDAISKSSGRE